MSLIEERIKELGFNHLIDFHAENKTAYPTLNIIGVYIIRYEKEPSTKTGKSNIFKIGEEKIPDTYTDGKLDPK